MATDAETMGCPVTGAGRDDRKTAKIAAANSRPQNGAVVAPTFVAARDILRSKQVKQAGAGAEYITLENPEHISFFFLDGELHQKRRAAVAAYFLPKTIVNRYHSVIHATMDRLIAELERDGKAPLDIMSFQMAVDVASEILGLTNSVPNDRARRIREVLELSFSKGKGGWLSQKIHMARVAWRTLQFYNKDMKPAIEARKKAPKDDVISYMVKENYSKKAMIIECMTYGSAGMMTTREFMVMAAWHMFEKADLRERYLNGTEQEQFAILEEIVRLEPVASMLHRKATVAEKTAMGELTPGQTYAIDIRAANVDVASVGECPFQLDPDRAKRMKVMGSYMSFGDGPHRCPGSQVALHETRIFLDRLFRIPGIRLAREPDITWVEAIGSYELRGSIVAVR